MEDRTPCPLHGESCGHYVPSDGPTTAKIALVGEGPGPQELRTLKPFVGPAGKLLNEELEKAGLKREDLFIYNAVPCFGSDNIRTPTDSDLKKWKPHLLETVKSFRPPVIVAAGAKALKAFTGKEGIIINQGIERRINLGDGYEPWLVPVYHPAYCLPSRSPLMRPALLKGLEKAKALADGAERPDWLPGYNLVDDGFLLFEAIEDLKKEPVLSFDIETNGSPYDTGDVVMVGIGAPGKKPYIFPVGHPEIRDGDLRAQIKGGIREIFSSNFHNVRLAHNGKYDVNFMKMRGFMAPDDPGMTWDTMLAAHMLDESRADRGRLKLKRIGMELFGITDYGARTVEVERPTKKGMKKSLVSISALLKAGLAYEIPLHALADYNARDVYLVLMLHEKFEPELEQWGLTKVFTDLAMHASKSMESLEVAGLPVDQGKLKELHTKHTAEVAVLEAELTRLLPEVENWNSYPQVAKGLYEVLRLPVVAQTEGGGRSTDESALNMLKGQHPVIEKLIAHRKGSKKLRTVTTLQEHLSPDGRIHPTMVIAGPSTGRTASRDPNVQNLDKGPGIRDCIRAGEGMALVELDQNQIELRWGAIIYEEPTLTRLLREGRDLHRYTASLAFGKAMDKVTEGERKLGKIANFLLIFEGGADRLSTELRDNGVTDEGARQALRSMGVTDDADDPHFSLAVELYKAYHRAYPSLRSAYQRIRNQVKREKMARSVFRRIRRLPEIDSAFGDARENAARQGINHVVQSPASDTLLLGLIPIVKNVAPMYNARVIDAVHDAILAEVPVENVDLFIRDAKVIMETPPFRDFNIDFPMPVVAEAKVGKSWGAMMSMEEWMSHEGEDMRGAAQDEDDREMPVPHRADHISTSDRENSGDHGHHLANTSRGVDVASPEVAAAIPLTEKSGLFNLRVDISEEMLPAALAYMQRGWSVIPLTTPKGLGYRGNAAGKMPAEGWEKYQTVVPSQDEIRRWFGNGAGRMHNIGIVTGVVSKLVVIDVDVDKGGMEWLNKTGLDSKLKVQTGGGGLHLYFFYDFFYDGPPLSNRVRMAPGVDVRAEGGQVAAPPSLHTSGKRYKWMTEDGTMAWELDKLPDWLAEEIRTQVPANVGEPVMGDGRAIPFERREEIIQLLLPHYAEGIRHDFQRALQGFLAKRNYRYEDVEDIVIGLMDGGGDIEDEDRLKLLRDTYEAARAGKTIAGSTALEEHVGKGVVETLQSLLGTVRISSMLEVMSAADFSAREMPKQIWVVDGILPAGGIFMLSGHPGAGKTTLTLQMAMQMATGKAVFGAFGVTHPMRVLYLQADNPPNMMQSLITRMLKRIPDAGDNLFISNVVRPVRINTPEGVEALEQVVGLYEPDLLVFDTIRDFHTADENNPTAVAETIDALKQLRNTLTEGKNMAIGYLHHHSKTFGYERAGIERHMGSMRFVTPVDLSMSLTFMPENAGEVKLSFTKIRWGPPQNPMIFRRGRDWYDHINVSVD